MIQLPNGLPLPLRDGYGFTPQSATLRTPLQTGRARKRRMFASVPTVAGVRWLLNDVQAQQFEAWYEEVLQGGVEWFEMNLKTPQGLQPYKARFVDSYSGPTLFGLSLWAFDAPIELWEKPVLKGGWAIYAPEYIRYSSIFDITMNSKWPKA